MVHKVFEEILDFWSKPLVMYAAADEIEESEDYPLFFQSSLDEPRETNGIDEEWAERLDNYNDEDEETEGETDATRNN